MKKVINGFAVDLDEHGMGDLTAVWREGNRLRIIGGYGDTMMRMDNWIKGGAYGRFVRELDKQLGYPSVVKDGREVLAHTAVLIEAMEYLNPSYKAHNRRYLADWPLEVVNDSGLDG